MLHLTTYFDKNYLSRGIVLYDSLKSNCSNFEIYVLALDDYTRLYFQNNKEQYPEVKIIKLLDLELWFPELKICKENRSLIEYYFTLSPCLPLYILENYKPEHICSLDADILFLDSPKALFSYLEEYSIIITPHKFSKELKSSEKFGIFNVSFQIFKNDITGMACLTEWKRQCINWCGDYYDEDRYADQKYLDEWPKIYNRKLKILNDNISGLAPWNLNNFQLCNNKKDYYSNNEKIIYYHFHNFKQLNERWATNGFKQYKIRRQKTLDKLYSSYWEKLNFYNKKLNSQKDDFIRYSDNTGFIKRLLNEKTVYFRLTKNKIILLDFDWVQQIIKFFKISICRK